MVRNGTQQTICKTAMAYFNVSKTWNIMNSSEYKGARRNQTLMQSTATTATCAVRSYYKLLLQVCLDGLTKTVKTKSEGSQLAAPQAERLPDT